MKGHGDEVCSYSNILRHPTWLAQTSGGCKSREFLGCVHIALADAGASYSSVVRVLVNEHFQRIMDKCSLHAFQSLNLWECLSLFWNKAICFFLVSQVLGLWFFGDQDPKRLTSLQSCTVSSTVQPKILDSSSKGLQVFVLEPQSRALLDISKNEWIVSLHLSKPMDFATKRWRLNIRLKFNWFRVQGHRK